MPVARSAAGAASARYTADVAQADAQALPYPTPRFIACSPRVCSTTFRIDRQRSMSSGGRLRQADAWCWPRTGRTTGRSVPADSVKAAAVGVCLHIAWVAGVALIGSGYDAELAYRGRLELVTDPMPAQAYPAAAEGGLSLPKATELIRSRLDQASASARAGLRQLGAEPGDGGRPSALLRLIRRAHATATAGANPDLAPVAARRRGPDVTRGAIQGGRGGELASHPCRARAGRARSCRRGRGRHRPDCRPTLGGRSAARRCCCLGGAQLISSASGRAPRFGSGCRRCRSAWRWSSRSLWSAAW